jgi:predicted DNA-binding WGR domain protein
MIKKIRLENTRAGHSRFYELWAGEYVNSKTGKIDSTFVGMRYGRIGTVGGTLFKVFVGYHARAEARTFLQSKFNEKLNRGYREVQ